MAGYQTSLRLNQESKLAAQKCLHDAKRSEETLGGERRKGDFLALPPLRALTDANSERQDKQLSPLDKWQIQRCSPPPRYCQEARVNNWLHKNHIRVLEKLPKMDPFVLTNRGADMSKYINFIYPPPISLKLISSEERGSKERTHERPPLPESRTPCPRLLRSTRSDREMFALNPVIRVGGGYRRLSWKVLDVLPAIGQYDSEPSPSYICMSCHASLPVMEKVTHSRGKLRTVIITPECCPNCGAHESEYNTVPEQDLHESVLDTLHRGDSRFIIDHRRFDNSNEVYFPTTTNSEHLDASAPMDWRDDMDSYRLHMSRQSQSPYDEDLDTRDQSTEQKRSESENSVFITETGANVDKITKSPDVRRAWDDGRSYAEVTKDFGSDSGGWGKRRENGSTSSCDDDNDAYTDFEMFEDYDPQSGFTVRLRRRTIGSAQMADYLIHGIQDDQLDLENTEVQSSKHVFSEKEKMNPFIPGNHGNKPLITGNHGDKQQTGSSTRRRSKPKKNAKKNVGAASNSIFTVGLDQRDAVFEEDPVIQDDDIIFPLAKFSSDSLSEGEISIPGDDLGPDAALSGISRSSRPSPYDIVNQDDRPYSSPALSTSPLLHDGYLADMEENADLGSLQAQIQQARSDTKKYQRRKEEGKVAKRKESNEKKSKISEDRTPSPHESETIPEKSRVSNGEWDSEWDSDFSLHVQPLSDLCESNSEEEPLRTGDQSQQTNPSAENNTRKILDETHAKMSRRKENSAPRDQDPDTAPSSSHKGAEHERTPRDTGGDAIRGARNVSRTYNIKPVPPDQPKPDIVYRRPRLRAAGGDDELSESDIKFYAQQLQAPYPRRDQQNGPSEESVAGCRGMNCYRCAALIPECQGVCSRCGTLCQRPGGPCKACRDVCETCGKPRYKCTSAGKRLEMNTEEKAEREEDFVDSESVDTYPIHPRQSTMFRENHDYPPVKTDERLGTEHFDDNRQVQSRDQRLKNEKNTERKTRTPPERKTKNMSNVKRVRGKRRGSLENKESELKEERKLSEAEPTRELVEEQMPLEDLPSQNRPSVSPTKSVRKAKPSKRIISQTVVYKGGDKKQRSQSEATETPATTNTEDSTLSIPEVSVETVESGDDSLPSNVEDAGKEIELTEQRPGNETTVKQLPGDVAVKKDDDVEVKSGMVQETGKEQETMEEEQQRLEEEKRKLIPKVRGVMRVNAAFKDRADLSKRLQTVLKEAISDVIGQADIRVRRDSTIDYLAQYRLVDRSRLEMYGRAFTLEDEDEDGILLYEQMLLALEGVPSITGMSRKQLLFVLQVLELGPGSRVTFKLFAVLTALCEKVTVLDVFVKQLVEELDLFDIECKLDLFRNMFFVAGNYSVTYITADQLRIELKAGGLNQKQEDHVISHILQSNETGQISFLDYMAYLPLFLSMHQNICDNALDMSRNKYQRSGNT